MPRASRGEEEEEEEKEKNRWDKDGELSEINDEREDDDRVEGGESTSGYSYTRDRERSCETHAVEKR